MKIENMTITDEKIIVTDQMMFDEGLSRWMINQSFGVPSDVYKTEIEWKRTWDLEEEDFDKIENYFLNKSNPNG